MRVFSSFYVFVLFFMFASPTAVGGVIYVDQNAPDITQNGTTWETAFHDLQDALDIAQFGDEVRVADGVYKPDRNTIDRNQSFHLINDIQIRGGYDGYYGYDPDYQDPYLFHSVLSGDLLNNDFASSFDNHTENSYNVINATSINNVTISGLKIYSGNANHTDIYDTRASGGAINLKGSSNIVVENCVIKYSSAKNGGGIYVSGGSDIRIEFSEFLNNRTISSTTSGNSAHGGGISGTSSDFTILNCTFKYNEAIGLAGFQGRGGAIYSGGTVRIVGCLICWNEANPAGGGGIFLSSSNNASIINCTIFENHGGFSDGVYLVATSATINRMANSILWGNVRGSGSFQYTDQQAQISSNYPHVLEHCTVQQWDWSWGGPNNSPAYPWLDSSGRLLENSPAIDSGVNNAWTDINIDINREPRFVDDPTQLDTGNGTPPIIDRGAFEFQVEIPCDAQDTDCDGIENQDDNCPNIANPLQEDFDMDLIGNECDDDIDNDGVLNEQDVCDFTPSNSIVNANGTLLSDIDDDCDVDLIDYSVLQNELTGP